MNGIKGLLMAMKLRIQDQMQNNLLKTINVSQGVREKECVDSQNIQKLIDGQVTKIQNMMRMLQFCIKFRLHDRLSLNMDKLEALDKKRMKPTLLQTMGCERIVVNNLNDLVYLFDYQQISQKNKALIVFYMHLLSLDLIDPSHKLGFAFNHTFNTQLNGAT